MKTAIRSLLILAVLSGGIWIFGSRGSAQQQPKTTTTPTATPRPAPTPPSEGQTDQNDTVFIREVRVPITVLDKNKLPVSGLTQSAFEIYEDKKLQTIVSFRDEKDNPPIYAVVMMDTSPSAAGKFRFEQDAAKDFIYTVTRLRKDKIAFLTFDHEITLRQDFTDKLDLLDRAIDAVKKPGTQTALYDAIYQFCDEKMTGLPGRHVVVMITDGDDTYSRATVQDAIEIAQRTETTVYIISTKAGFSGVVPGVEAGMVADTGDKAIMRLAAETGGASFFTGDQLALERSFTRIAKELRSQYVATYVPTNNRYDGSNREIEVKLVDNSNNYKLRAKKGYKAVNPRL
jgi:VWFA-related protein